MSDRPSWMPSDEEVEEAMMDRLLVIAAWAMDDKARDANRAIHRLIERAALKAQIETVLNTMKRRWVGAEWVDALDELLTEYRARLAELEGGS